MIGTELLDLHLASDAASDIEEGDASGSPGASTGAGEPSEHSFPGPAALRLAKVCVRESSVDPSCRTS